MQVTQNLTGEYNYGTSIFEEPMDFIHYQMNKSFNWTEADMVFLQPDEYPYRLDYRFNPEDPNHNWENYVATNDFLVDYYDVDGVFVFDAWQIPNYNRFYHSSEEDKILFTSKKSLLLDDDGEVV